MRRYFGPSALFFSGALALACGGKFVRKDEVQRISKDYEGVFVLKDRVDVGNFDTLNKGAKVKLYFKTAGDYVAVQAYPYSQPREEAVGKNILQLFEGDFPDKKFNEQFLRERLALVVEEYKGKLDAAPTQKGFGSDLQKGSAPPPLKDSSQGGGRPGHGGRGRR